MRYHLVNWCTRCLLWVWCSWVITVEGRGLLLLYRPQDVSKECAMSQHLRFDLSFGMGMSDTITLVLRNLPEVDYECLLEIVAENIRPKDPINIIVVIRLPNIIIKNCYYNPYSLTVLKSRDCLRVCDLLQGRQKHTPFFNFSVNSRRVRFRFVSNSSINTDIKAYQYEITATAARKKGKQGCLKANETICNMDDEEYCFTSGVVCDGIKNCGVPDWFDERKSDCELPVETLGYTQVIAVAAAIFCALLAVTHLLFKCLPPRANSFFIFNANEDNRLCILPILRPPSISDQKLEAELAKRFSIIPVPSSSSGSETSTGMELRDMSAIALRDNLSMLDDSAPRKTTMRSMTAKIQEKIRYVTGRGPKPTDDN